MTTGTPLSIALLLLSAWLAIEGIMWLLVRSFRPDFQWLITPRDETPDFAPDLVEKYGRLSFDSELGWMRRAGTTGVEQTLTGESKFAIDADGARLNPDWTGKPSGVAVYGDSFAFCRLVNDDETWPHFLSAELQTNVRNFGVGNYGVDQALLRLKREIDQIEAQCVVMAVVPETIVRIHSYWKHYFEYGNILAFKPRFRIERGALRHFPPAVRTLDGFRAYRERLAEIRALDEFYDSKFRWDLLRFPYALRLVTRARRLLPILGWLVYGRATGAAQESRRRAFAVVLADNARFTSRLLRRDDARELLRRLVAEFAQVCRSAGKEPLLMVIPQPVDLEAKSKGDRTAEEVFASLRDLLPVADMTGAMTLQPRHTMYVEGSLGPHTSAHANLLIARELASVLRDAMGGLLARRQDTVGAPARA